VYYPFPDSFPLWKTGGAVLVLVMITVASLRLIRSCPFLIIGWLWFAGMMFPLSGIAQIGTQSRSDHYAYIPLIGLLIFIVWGGAAVVEKLRLPGKLTAAASVIVIVLLAFLSWRQAGYWKNSETLMRHALNVTRNNFEAHNYLAQALAEQGDPAAAVDHFQKALAIKPDHLKSHINLANVYISSGQTDKAIYHLTRALEKDPTDARLYNNLGALYEKTGDVRAALANYRKAVSLNPGYAPAYDNLAAAEAGTGDLAGAIGHFQQALTLNSRSAGTHFRLAVVLFQAGRAEEARKHLLQAITLDPADRRFRELLDIIRQDQPAAATGTEN
jgi:tetratricopeptide (TPR) repeat protein